MLNLTYERLLYSTKSTKDVSGNVITSLLRKVDFGFKIAFFYHIYKCLGTKETLSRPYRNYMKGYFIQQKDSRQFLALLFKGFREKFIFINLGSKNAFFQPNRYLLVFGSWDVFPWRCREQKTECFLVSLYIGIFQ